MEGLQLLFGGAIIILLIVIMFLLMDIKTELKISNLYVKALLKTLMSL